MLKRAAVAMLFVVLSITEAFADSTRRVSLIIQDQDGMPVEGAEVKVGRGTLWGAILRAPSRELFVSRWEIELEPSQTDLRIRVTKSDAFLVGEYNGAVQGVVTIRLRPDTSAGVRGRVQDELGRAIRGAMVTVEEFPVSATTDADGRFMLDLRTGDGKSIRLRAEKKGCESADQYHMAGEHPATLVLECK